MHRLGFEKVFFHIDHLYDFYKRGDNYPVHVTVGLTSYCNHRCVFCYGDYETSDPARNFQIDTEALLETLAEGHALGLKSVSLVGTGEPLLHKDASRIIRGIREIGLEVAVYTNGVMVDGDVAETILDCCTWIRLSCNAKNNEEHLRIHQGRATDFDRVTNNFRRLVLERNRRGQLFPTIGCQFAAFQGNHLSVYKAGLHWKKVGLDYFAIKPVYRHEKNASHPDNTLDHEKFAQEMRQVEQLQDERFQVYAKYEQFREVLSADFRRGYQKCFGQAFSTALLADGNFYLCGNLHSEPRYALGNIYTDGGFRAIWNSEQRQQVISAINLWKCPTRCRNHPLNEILWGLKNQDAMLHPNFL